MLLNQHRQGLCPRTTPHRGSAPVQPHTGALPPYTPEATSTLRVDAHRMEQRYQECKGKITIYGNI